MKIAAAASLGVALLLASACEMGWDVNGHVVTKDAPDKSRPLLVYGVDAPTIDPAAFMTAARSIDYSLIDQAPSTPADGFDFHLNDLGCHRGFFAAVAWAPATAPTSGPDCSRPAFAPQAGDYVAFSDVRHPYCGWRSEPEEIVVVLDGRTFP